MLGSPGGPLCSEQNPPQGAAEGQRVTEPGPSSTLAPTHPSLGVAVAGADDGSCLLNHLQDGSPVDVPCDVGIVRAHDPAGGEPWELAPLCRARSPGGGAASQRHPGVPDELPGHLTTLMPATSPAPPARGFLRAGLEAAPDSTGRGRWHRPSAQGGGPISPPPCCGDGDTDRAGHRPPLDPPSRQQRRLLPQRQITVRQREGEAR